MKNKKRTKDGSLNGPRMVSKDGCRVQTFKNVQNIKHANIKVSYRQFNEDVL